MTDHEVTDGTNEAAGPNTDAGEAPDDITDADTDADSDAEGDDGRGHGGDESVETTGADVTEGDAKGDESNIVDEADGGAVGAADGDDGPTDGKGRLEALQEDIDEVRRRVADPTGQGEHTFIEEGEADEDQPVDDTIAPG